MSGHKFDIVVFGATGYVGRLVTEHLVREYGGALSDAPKWAMAGRKLARLQSVRDDIGAPGDTPLITADASDPASLRQMCKQARVVLTTVGPYQLYGDNLVAACIATGTSYADLCAEPAWMAEQIERHHEAAKASGARICFSSGFDSIPFDLGVLMLQKHATERFGIPAPRVKTRIRSMEGTSSSDDTAAIVKATIMKAAKDPSLIKKLADPFALTPGFTGPEQPGSKIPKYDRAFDSWAAPILSASINTRNVHRTNYLLGHPYGKNFRYDEMALFSPGEIGKKAIKAVTRYIKSRFGRGEKRSGEGPSNEKGENGSYEILILGEYPDGRTVRCVVEGRDEPGYVSTSRMLAETGIALLESEGSGGIGTPGSILGEALVERLREHAGLTFTSEG